MGSREQWVTPDLSGRCILVVEDEFFIASDIVDALHDLGAEVAGPVPSMAAAYNLAREVRLDGAVLDINLHGEMVWPVVDELLARNVPVTLATGYSAAAIPQAYVDLPRHEKPSCARELARMVAARVGAAG